MNQRRRLLLMRHGEVAYFDPLGRPLPADVAGLTSVGHRQALEAGELLGRHGFRPDLLITSSLPRTQQTARLVLGACGADGRCTNIVEPAFDEIRGGRLAELSVDQLHRAFTALFDAPPSCVHETDPERTFLGGESLRDFLARVDAALDRWLHGATWSTALWVLHGGVNRAILSRFMAGRGSFLAGLEQDPGCINVLDVDPDGTRAVIGAVNHRPGDPLRWHSRGTTMEALLQQYLRHRIAEQTPDP